MVEINIEIEEIGNGFTIEDSYFDTATYCKTFDEAVKKANKYFKRFKKEQEY